MRLKEGYVQLYTGNGKGKTTAAFGLALRALNAGLKVFIGQFVKSMKYNEVGLERLFPEGQVIIKQFGDGCYFDRTPTEEDKRKARLALCECATAMQDGNYDVVILDELTIAIHLELLSDEEVMEAIEGRAGGCEVIITGRYASVALIEYADLVTEMREVKHYFTQGVLSRKGIDC